MFALKGGWREWERAGFPVEEKESEQPAIVQGCIDCHTKVTPRIVSEWEESKHSTNMVSCLMCHGAGHMSEQDVDKAAAVKPEICMFCHDAQSKQFAAGKHAAAWKAMKALPAAHWQPMASLEGPAGCKSCHKIGFKDETEIRELRKEGAGFGIASCDTCHTRHSFSVDEARQPEACRACHRGIDHPLWETYSSSKHGIRHSLKRQGTIPVYTPAPTCQDCHMRGGDHEVRTAWGFLAVRLPVSEGTAWAAAQTTLLQALGMLDPKGRPTERHALIGELDLARLTEEDWRRDRDRAVQGCLECHPAGFVKRFFDRGDRVVMESDLLLAEAVRLVADLYRDNILKPPATYPYPFPDLLSLHDERAPIEARLYEMFLKHRMRAFKGAFHANPEYAFDHGLSAMQRELAKMRAEEQQLRNAARKRR